MPLSLLVMALLCCDTTAVGAVMTADAGNEFAPFVTS